MFGALVFFSFLFPTASIFGSSKVESWARHRPSLGLGGEHRPRRPIFLATLTLLLCIRSTTDGGIANRAMQSKIAVNKFSVTATSDSQMVKHLECRASAWPRSP
jgi:hypothetical protein